MLHGVNQITIIGTGLLGGSIGLGLRDAGYQGQIMGLGRQRQTVEEARLRGCVDEVCTDLGAAVRDSQLVILATPLSSFQTLLDQIAREDHDDLVITDVGSTKQQVYAMARQRLPQPARFVGSHPMAGGERHGPKHARADLFRGKPCIITLDDDTDRGARLLVEDLWTQLGMRLIHLSAEEHDRQVAVISHLPHLLASLIVELASDQGGLEIASTGFGDTTRVASGDPKVWLDIFTTNQEAVIHAIDVFSDRLATFRQVLTRDDHRSILEFLQRSKEARDRWPKTGFDRRRSTGSD